MNQLRKRIQENYYQLSDTNKLIADVILSYENTSFSLNLVNLAKKSYCSNSSITKFINYFGYPSYKIFTYDLNAENKGNLESIVASFQLVDTYYKHYAKVIEMLVDNIKKANKVYLFASGSSQISPLDFSVKCNKKDSGKFIFESNIKTQEILLNTISNVDFVLFISNSGESRELIQFLKTIDTEHIFLITNRENSTLKKQIKDSISLENTLEDKLSFKEFPRESKYSLLYFFDLLFAKLYS